MLEKDLGLGEEVLFGTEGGGTEVEDELEGMDEEGGSRGSDEAMLTRR